MFNLPNLFTAGNFICGIIAIVIGMYGRLELACLALGFAMVFDFLDGFIARLTKTSSSIGKDLDSLADLVSFGLAPGILMFMTIELRQHIEPEMVLKKYQLLEFHRWEDFLALSALSIPFFSLFRLAKFNNDSRQGDRFIGVPTPTNTIFFLFFPLLHWQIGIENTPPVESSIPWVLDPLIMAVTALLFPVLLISEIPLLSLKIQNFSLKDNLYQYLLLSVSLITILGFKTYALPIIVLLYVILSIIENQTTKKA